MWRRMGLLHRLCGYSEIVWHSSSWQDGGYAGVAKAAAIREFENKGLILYLPGIGASIEI